MEAPDKLYIEIDKRAHVYFGLQPESAVEYIRKDALMEWILKGIEMSEICHSEYGDACAQAYQSVIDKLNSM